MINIKEFKDISKSFRVLYVEDDISIQASMSQYLSKIFLEVITANDGLQGLKYYKKDKFDIVITDLSMPHMNGLEMLEKIKKIDENQNILITTAYSEPGYMFSAIKLGIEGYILKPFDYEQLNHELYKIVYKLKKFEENEEYKKHLKEMVEQKTSELSNMMKIQNDNYEKTLLSMVEMIEDRDTYTAGHSKRVAEYSSMIAKEMGYSEQECLKLYQAGILHDVGKVATPDSVLLNPKNLNEIEYKLIQEHVEVSYKLLNTIPMFNNLAKIVQSHHERYDGLGYPRGLKANEIEPLSRIMIVADAFDAMTTSRIYKAKKSVSEAIDELEKLKFKQFHPEVIDKAIIVLSRVKIDANITQLPKSKLEEERFAYFYKDTLSNVYNQDYLDVILMKTSYENELRYMDIFSLNDFSIYNKKHGWNKGSEFIYNFATCLNNHLTKPLVFRIFGDTFAVICTDKIPYGKALDKLDELCNLNDVEYSLKSIDLTKTKIKNTTQIESYNH